LNGQQCVQCIYDTDCPSGNYCSSGTCQVCVVDRHCGPGCGSCGLAFGPPPSCTPTTTTTPACYSPDNTAKSATCVQCMQDSDCGTGGQCNTSQHTCTNALPTGVMCTNASQCACGSGCDSTGTCTSSCTNNNDCQGNECCTTDPNNSNEMSCQAYSADQCETGGGALCACSISATHGSPGGRNPIDPFTGKEVAHSRGTLLAFCSMFLCALLLRRRRLMGRMG